MIPLVLDKRVRHAREPSLAKVALSNVRFEVC